jgi:hypothetical protein
MRVWFVVAAICLSVLAAGATVALLLSSTPDSGVRGWLTYEGEPGGPTGYLRPGSIVAIRETALKRRPRAFRR